MLSYFLQDDPKNAVKLPVHNSFSDLSLKFFTRWTPAYFFPIRQYFEPKNC